MAWAVQRGAHTFFLRMGKVPRWGGYTVNLIHYEDAARLAAAVSPCLSAASSCRTQKAPASPVRSYSKRRWAAVALSYDGLWPACLASVRLSGALGAQVLRGDGSEQPYRGRVFLGADGMPVTFQVGQAMALLCAHMMAPSFMASSENRNAVTSLASGSQRAIAKGSAGYGG